MLPTVPDTDPTITTATAPIQRRDSSRPVGKTSINIGNSALKETKPTQPSSQFQACWPGRAAPVSIDRCAAAPAASSSAHDGPLRTSSHPTTLEGQRTRTIAPTVGTAAIIVTNRTDARTRVVPVVSSSGSKATQATSSPTVTHHRATTTNRRTRRPSITVAFSRRPAAPQSPDLIEPDPRSGNVTTTRV